MPPTHSERFEALLQASAFLGDLDPFSRTALCMHFEEVHHAAGDVVMRAGEAGDRILLLLDGWLEVRLPADQGGELMATLGADQLLGEVAFFGLGVARVADAIAVDDLVAASLSRATYDAMLQSDPGAAETLEKLVLDVMLRRISSINEQVVELVGSDDADPAFRAEARFIAREL